MEKKKNVSYIEANFVSKNHINFIPPEGSEIIVIARLVPTSDESCNYEIKSANGKPAAIYMVKGMSATIPFDAVRQKFVYSCVNSLNEYKIRANVVSENNIINGVLDRTVNIIQLPYVTNLNDVNKREDLFIVMQKSMTDLDEKGNLTIKTSAHNVNEHGVDSKGEYQVMQMQAKVVTRDYIAALSNTDEKMVKRLIKASNEYVDSLNITNMYGKITSTIPESVNDLI